MKNKKIYGKKFYSFFTQYRFSCLLFETGFVDKIYRGRNGEGEEIFHQLMIAEGSAAALQQPVAQPCAMPCVVAAGGLFSGGFIVAGHFRRIAWQTGEGQRQSWGGSAQLGDMAFRRRAAAPKGLR